jgi:hypothetical protein
MSSRSSRQLAEKPRDGPFRDLDCRASSTRRGSSVRTLADWPQPSRPSDVESRLPSRVWRRRCFPLDKRAQNLRNRWRCQRTTVSAQTSAESASASTAGRVRPRTVGPGSQNGPSPFSVGRARVEAEKSILHRDGRMTAEEESGKNETGTGRRSVWASILGLHGDESQAGNGEPNIGEPQIRFCENHRAFHRLIVCA